MVGTVGSRPARASSRAAPTASPRPAMSQHAVTHVDLPASDAGDDGDGLSMGVSISTQSLEERQSLLDNLMVDAEMGADDLGKTADVKPAEMGADSIELAEHASPPQKQELEVTRPVVCQSHRMTHNQCRGQGVMRE